MLALDFGNVNFMSSLGLALLLKLVGSKVDHVMIGHRLTAAKKRPFFRWLKAHSHMRCIAAFATRPISSVRRSRAKVILVSDA